MGNRPVNGHSGDMNENMGKKSLRRSKSQRILAGVCGGIGEFLGVDANLIRLAFGVFLLLGGSGIVLYVIAWLVMPEQDSDGSVLEHIIRNFQGKKSNL